MGILDTILQGFAAQGGDYPPSAPPQMPQGAPGGYALDTNDPLIEELRKRLLAASQGQGQEQPQAGTSAPIPQMMTPAPFGSLAPQQPEAPPQKTRDITEQDVLPFLDKDKIALQAPPQNPQAGTVGAPRTQTITPAMATVQRPDASVNAEPTFMERLAALGQGYEKGGLLGGIGQAFGTLPKAQQTENLTIQALVQRGMDQGTATAIARNPQLMQQIAPQIFGAKQGVVINNRLVDPSTGKLIADFSDTSLKAPETREFSDPATGDKFPAYWDAARINPQTGKPGVWLRIDPQGLGAYNAGAGQPQGQPQQPNPGLPNPGNLGVAPQGQPQGQPQGVPQQAPQMPPQDQQPGRWAPPPGAPYTPYAIPPAPPGANVAKWREEQSSKMADEQKNDRDKAVGSIEFLQQAQAARQAIAQQGHVIGRYAQYSQPEHGTDPKGETNTQYFQRQLSDLRDAGGMLPFDALGFGADNRARDELNQTFTKLAQSGLKATYGNRITQIDVKQQNQTVPRLTDQDADTSLSKLNTIEDISWRNLQQGLQSGLVAPGGIPSDVLSRGIAQGRLNPGTWYRRG